MIITNKRKLVSRNLLPNERPVDYVSSAKITSAKEVDQILSSVLSFKGH